MSYLGIPPFGQTVRTITEIIASAGQTSFAVSGGYITGYVDVYLNGVALASSDFTATNNTNIVLNVAAEINDEFKSIAYFPVSLVDTYRASQVDALIANLDSDLTGVNISIANLDSDLTGVNISIANLDSDLSSVNTSIANLDSDLSSVNTSIANLDSDLSSVNTSIANLDSDLSNLDANSTSKSLYEMANTISTNYTITAGNNAISAGPITIDSGVLVTIPSGSRWVVV
jgi:trimeric autotransporter adhesin